MRPAVRVPLCVWYDCLLSICGHDAWMPMDPILPRLDIVAPDGARERRAIGARGIRIGRSADVADIVLAPDPQRLVSKLHCLIEPRDGAWCLVDNGSTNGTFVRQRGEVRRVRGVAPLADGDVVLLLAELQPPRFWELTFDDASAATFHAGWDPDSVPARAESSTPAICLEYDWVQARLYRVAGGGRAEIGGLRLQEQQLVRHMAERNRMNGNVPVLCTYEDLIRAVWGEDSYHSQADVTHLVWELRKKLDGGREHDPPGDRAQGGLPPAHLPRSLRRIPGSGKPRTPRIPSRFHRTPIRAQWFRPAPPPILDASGSEPPTRSNPRRRAMLTSSLIDILDGARSVAPQLKRRVRWLMGIRPTGLTLLLLAALAALCLLAPASVGAASPPRKAAPVSLAGTGVVDVGQVEGFKSAPDQFAALLDALYTDSRWDFFPDGTFAFAPNPAGVGSESYLYPIVGVWQKNGDGTVAIAGESAAALSKETGGGRVVQRLEGVLYERDGRLLMDIQETDTLGSQQADAAYTIGLDAA